MKVSVLSGDITQVPADALITGINPSGMWFGGVDAALQQVAGDAYHGILADVLHQDRYSEVVVAEPKIDIATRFDKVIFVIDDLSTSLRDVVLRGLQKASRISSSSVTMSMIRFGVMSVVEPSPQEKMQEIAEAIQLQKGDPMNSIETLYIVVYGNEVLKSEMTHTLEAAAR